MFEIIFSNLKKRPRRAGVHPRLVGEGDALDPVDAAFEAQVRVALGAGHRDDGRPEAAHLHGVHLFFCFLEIFKLYLIFGTFGIEKIDQKIFLFYYKFKQKI